MIDYHVHTSLCNHANGTMEEYVRQAILAGLSEICFLDHLTLHERGRHMSMAPADVPLYYQTIRRLGHIYKNDILVKAGLEIDYDPQNAPEIKKIIQPYDFDTIGGSVHFIDEMNIVSSKDTKLREMESIDVICDHYLTLMKKMLEDMDLDIICHLDVTKKFGRRPSAAVKEKFEDILSEIRHRNLALELNTSGFNHAANEFYPDAALLKKCFEKNIRVTLGSDAHEPRQVARHFDDAMALLAETGYRAVTAFHRRAPYDVPLPATVRQL
jgi:histidinol-phosphatase (PHP family)